MSLINNPIILGLLVSVCSYVYSKSINTNVNVDLEEKQVENNKNNKNNKKNVKDELDVLKYPIILGIIVFIIMSVFQNTKTNIGVNKSKLPVQPHSTIPQSIGETLPRVFLETI